MTSRTVKVTTASLLALGLIVAPVLSGDFASAATSVTKDSKGIVKFDKSTTPDPDPVNPDPVDPDPVIPDPTDPPVGTDGLWILAVSDWDFGTHNVSSLSSGALNVHAADDTISTYVDANGNGQQDLPGEVSVTKKVTPYAQISDVRGTNTGWTLSVTGSAFKDSSTPAKTIPGAELTIPKSTVSSATSTAQAPTGYDSVTISMTGGAAVPVMAAKDMQTATPTNFNDDQGMGTWTDSFGSQAVSATDTSKPKLSIPKNVVVADGTYQSTLTWTLSDTPAV
ncbi:WxL domain-containing protein [Listeria monocytogenes]|uniref:WxL domain-containing protein n=9 Tax=Listeria monocytogenes TaxID=1639 RepID=A0A9P1YIX9_LISMN|nr:MULTISPECIES: WxL domain-containing protein [Listeria]EAD5035061.1 WxL domain-containing protein [Listeria monocytogenes serotype 1/2a]EAD5050360.1 WxL domain-containing protein [Listeria monocytogenes serotype 4b]EAE1679768.1 WxL domain-containing protein [Listeria monocytogenes LIS0071]EAE3704205.1 WxL domain-containing protein [Listeria monocytogenes serotype 1/2b]EAE6023069.1 WxL domain-containing protein [Listeria monocytogenes serotype 3a]EAG6254918.1 WxL domain-containing protein [L